jgi:hypothetical protein
MSKKPIYSFPHKGKIDTLSEVKTLSDKIEADKTITNDKRRKRLQFLHSLTFTKSNRKNLGSDAKKAQEYTEKAYKKYVKKK